MTNNRSIGFVKPEAMGLQHETPINSTSIDEAADIINFTPVVDGYEDILKLPPAATSERRQKFAALMDQVTRQNAPWTESAFDKIHASYPWIDTLMVDPYGRTIILADARGFQFRGFWGAPVQYNDVRRPPTSEELVVMVSQLQAPLFLVTYPLDMQLYVSHDIFPDLRRAFERGLRSKKQSRILHKISGKEGKERDHAILEELQLIETEIDEVPFKPETFARVEDGKNYKQFDIIRVNSGVLGGLQGELQREFAFGRIVLKDIGQKVKGKGDLGFKPAGTKAAQETEAVGYYSRVYLGDHPAMPYIEVPGQGKKRQPVYITPVSEADEFLSGKVPTSTGERAHVIYSNPLSNLAVDALMAYAGDRRLNGTPLILTHAVDRRWVSR